MKGKNTYYIGHLLLIVFAISITGCNKYSIEVETTLKKAGENRNELVSVLEHYSKNPDDSLKYKAACFLIENMKWHYGKKCKSSDGLWNLFLVEDSLLSVKMRDTNFWKSDQALRGYKYLAKKMLITSNIGQLNLSDEYILDAYNFNSDFLINTIESAFKVKDLKWNQHLSFDEFCEYVLAYRFNSEPVFDIRKELYSHFERRVSVDSMEMNSFKTIMYLNRYIDNLYWDWDEPDVILPDLGFYNLLYWNINKMNCGNHIAAQGAVLRSLGIPVTEVFTPKWNDSSLGHSWCGLYSDEGKFTLFSAIYEDPGTHLKRFGFDLATTFYLKTFSAQKNSPFFLKSETEVLPDVFASPCIKNITSQFVSTSCVELALKSAALKNNVAYFCCFTNGNWIPVAWGIINHDKQTAFFENIPVGQIGISCIYDGQSMIPFGELGKIGELGKYEVIKPDNKKGTIKLLRKFPQKLKLRFFAEDLIGATIEAANRPDFSDSTILTTLTDTLFPYLQDITFPNINRYRYYRIVAPGYELNLAELEFITYNKSEGDTVAKPLPIFDLAKNKQPPTYKIKGELGSSNNDNRAFDGNILTYTNAKWLRIDLRKPKCVNTVRLAPRNANNGITIGDSYELLYWDDEWLSFDKKKAQYNFLEFENVPNNTYYWLRNITTGREEQPFLFKFNYQIF